MKNIDPPLPPLAPGLEKLLKLLVKYISSVVLCSVVFSLV